MCEIAHARALAVHMDGARFANALVRLNATPAQMTWQSGIDVLSFGATKGGAMAAEAVVVFDPARAAFFGERRKRAGHLLSKHRFLAAQLAAYLAGDRWLDAGAPRQRHGRPAGAEARGASALRRSGRSRPISSSWPCRARSTPAQGRRRRTITCVRAKSSDLGADRVLVRLVTSFATREEEIERFVNLCKKF